jgi:N-acetylneuraminic acid mutarotase
LPVQPTASGPQFEIQDAAHNSGNSGPLTPSADTYLREAAPNQNQGTETSLRVQNSGNNRVLMMWDPTVIAQAIGAGTLTAARIELTISDNGDNWGTSGRTIDLHPMTRAWTESGATWNCAEDANPINRRRDCADTTAWEMGNPDSAHPWVPTPTATLTIHNGDTGVVTFDVTADVAGIVTGGGAQYGWILKKTNERANGRVEFGSRESASGPRLVLTVHTGADFWTIKTPMSTPRRLSAAVEYSGNVYTFGGCASTCFQPPFKTSAFEETRVEVYDPATDTWTARAAMPDTFFIGAAAAPGNGKIYTLGGVRTGNIVREYDPTADSWTIKASMPTGRYGLAAVPVNGKIYAIGGNGPSGAVEEYDPVTNAWTAKSPMPTPRLFFATAVVDGKIYAMGGSPDAEGNTQTSVVEVYDPVTDTWATMAPLPAAIQVSAGTSVAGKAYVFGGFFVCCAALNTTFVYDPVTDTWATKAPMLTARDEAPAVVVNGTVYVIGGADDGRNALSANENYTP